MLQPIFQTFFVAGHQLRLLLRSKRMIIVLLIVGLAPFLASLTIDPKVPMQHLAPISILLVLSILAPLTGLLLGSTVITEDVEAKTLTYVFTRPIARPSLFLGRWLACTLLVCALMALTSGYIGWEASQYRFEWEDRADLGPVPEGVTQRLIWASVLCGAMYTTLAAGLSTSWRRPIVFGLGYAFVWEMVAANLPGSTQRLSMQYYLRGILVGPDLEAFGLPRNMLEVEYLTPWDSSLRLVIFMVLLLLVGCFTVRRKQYLLSS